MPRQVPPNARQASISLRRGGSKQRIVGAHLDGKHGYAMMGHTYWDAEFSNSFIDILQSEWMRPGTADKLWDEIFYAHTDQLQMRMRVYPAGVIHELIRSTR